MSPTPDQRALAEPRWLERWRIKRAGRRDRLPYRELPLGAHTPWTRTIHARYATLALEARRAVLDRRHRLEEERDRLRMVEQLADPAPMPERPDESAGTREWHLWAVEARRVRQEVQRRRDALIRLKAIDAELANLDEVDDHVVRVHEQAYLSRVQRYNAARAWRGAASGKLSDPPFVVSGPRSDDHPQLFLYPTAA